MMFEHINAQKLIVTWPQIHERPYLDHHIRIDDKKHPVVKKNDDIHDLFTYFKLIPTHRSSFDTAVSSFVVYSKVNCA